MKLLMKNFGVESSVWFRRPFLFMSQIGHNIPAWQPPTDLESYVQEVGRGSSYVQEVGRGGRDGKSTKAILHYNKEGLKHASYSMTEYCTNTEQCHWKILMGHFIEAWQPTAISSTCQCCDICQR